MKERLLRLKVKQVIRLDICPGIEYTRLTKQAMISLQGMVHCLKEQGMIALQGMVHCLTEKGTLVGKGIPLSFYSFHKVYLCNGWV